MNKKLSSCSIIWMMFLLIFLYGCSSSPTNSLPASPTIDEVPQTVTPIGAIETYVTDTPQTELKTQETTTVPAATTTRAFVTTTPVTKDTHPVEDTENTEAFLFLWPQDEDITINSEFWLTMCNWPDEDAQARIIIERPDGTQTGVLEIPDHDLWYCGDGPLLSSWRIWLKPSPEEGELPGIWKITIEGIQSGFSTSIEIDIKG